MSIATTTVTSTVTVRVHVVECDACDDVVTLTDRELTFAVQSRSMLLRRGLTLCAGCTTDLRAQTRK